MELKLGKQCKWEDIEIGEVFAYDGCIVIMCKVAKNEAIVLAEDTYHFDSLAYAQVGEKKYIRKTSYGSNENKRFFCNSATIHGDVSCIFNQGIDNDSLFCLYKLPLEVQQLWKTE